MVGLAFKTPSLSDAVWAKLSPVIESEVGIQMPIDKKALLQNRLLKRLRILGLETFEEYCDYLFSKDGQEHEMTAFLNEITTNKTYFFREFRHFEVLNDRIIPEFLATQKNTIKPFRIWSAAASTGEEVYSIACIIEEYMRTENVVIPYEILGSDLSTRVLWHAYDAIYDEEQVRMISPDLKRRYFLERKNSTIPELRVSPEVRAHVKFCKINLMSEKYPHIEKFDVVFCRNVLIYFSRPDIHKIMKRMLEHLKDGGYLITGHADAIPVPELKLKRIEPSIYAKV
ncbi:MAG: Chemotaxis protein methyltransferase [Turneriella sp.]|nr:Chemotaxis protein methyltransferase [Turneriella sp.]